MNLVTISPNSGLRNIFLFLLILPTVLFSNTQNTSNQQGVIVVNTQDITVYLDANGEVSITADDIDNNSTAVSGIQSKSIDIDFFDCSNKGDNTVTLTITDNDGVSSSATSTVTVEDNTPPTITISTIAVAIEPDGTTSYTLDLNNAANDNCDTPLTSFTIDDLDCANLTGAATFTAGDFSGNITSKPLTVILTDKIFPVAVTKDITVQLDANGQASITANDIDNGSSDNCGIVNRQIDQSFFTCGNLGDNTVTLTITDVSGNMTSETATVTVEDNINPTLSLQSHTLQLDATGNVTLFFNDVNNGSTDNCTIQSSILTPSTFDCSDIGAQNVSVTITDQSGNTDTQIIGITVVDQVKPVLLTQNISKDLDPSSQVTITPADIDLGSTDNCSIASQTLSQTAFDCSHLGVNNVTYTVTDVNGNVATKTIVVSINDTESPNVITQDISRNLDASGNLTITSAEIDNGSTDNCSIQSITVTPSTFDCTNTGANTVTLSVTDTDGNTKTETAIVTVIDNIDPTLILQNITIQLDANGTYNMNASEVVATNTDNCTTPTLTPLNTTFDCSHIGTTQSIDITSTDASGNTATETAQVTVTDQTDPIAVITDNQEFDLDATGNISITAAQIDNGSTDNCAIDQMTISQTNFDCSQTGNQAIDFTLTDPSGNTTTVPVNVIIKDITNPVASGKNISVNLDATGNLTILAADVDNGSSDNCGTPTLTLSKSTFDCTETGDNTVTLIATDPSGNTHSTDVTVTVTDNIDPTLILQNITIQLDANGTYNMNASEVVATNTDNCTTPTLSPLNTTFDCSHIGTTQSIDITSTDASGNTATETAQVTVTDQTDPIAVITDNQEFDLDASGNVSITALQIDNGSTDNCAIDQMTISQTNFDCSQTGNQSIDFTLTDPSGNTTTVPVNVIIKDITNPVASGKNISVNLDATGNVTILPADVDNGSSDNCGTPTLTLSKSTFDCTETGDNTVTLIATDPSGNTHSTDVTVTVTDNIDPTLILQNITIQLDANGTYNMNASEVVATNTDNCTTPTLSPLNTTFDCSHIGTTQSVTITSTDASGNTTTETAQVTVTDQTDPIAVITDNQEFDLDATGNISITAAQIDNGSTDNCAIDQMTISQTNFDCSQTGNQAIDFTLTDPSGNMTTVPVNVIIKDITNPVASGKNISVNLDATGNLTILPTDVDNGSSDNCGTPTLTLSKSTFDCTETGDNTVTLIATDPSGNTHSTDVTVTVTDIIAPVIDIPNQSLALDQSGNLTIAITDLTNNTTDNCGPITYTIDQTTFDCTNQGVNSITVTATDAYGNSSNQTIDLTIEDSTDPVGIVKNVTFSLDQNGSLTITPNDIDDGSTDNCGIVTKTLDQTTFDCNHLGPTTVNLTLTDASGNSTTVASTVNVVDNLEPTVITQNITVTLDMNGQASILPTDIDNGSTDNCGIDRMELSTTSFDCSNLGDNNVILLVYDINGNLAPGTAVVTILENVSPTVIGKNITVQLDNTGNVTITPQQVDNGSTAACGTITLSLDKTMFDCSHVGTPQSVTLTGTTPSGLNDSQTVTVTVTDQTDPIAFITDNQKFYLDASGNVSITAAQIDNGSTDNCAIDQMTISQTNFDCSQTGNQSIDFTLTDPSGNTTTVPVNVIIIDDNYPSITCNPTINITLTTGNCDDFINVPQPTNLADNCNTTNLTITYEALNDNSFNGTGDANRVFSSGTTTLIWTATDQSGNSTNCPQQIIVEEDTPPTITCPSKITSCQTVVDYASPIATDNCSNVTLTQTAGLPSGSTFPTGISTLTYEAIDASGNTESCSFEIEVSGIPEITLDQNHYQLVYGESLEIPIQFKNVSGAAEYTPDYLIQQSLNSIIFTADTPFDTVITITAESPQKCTTTEKITLEYTINLTIPTAFTPNGDGTNDTWYIENFIYYPEAEITIFNRNGKEIYHGDYLNEWDGTYNGNIQPIGPYYYVIDLNNGTSVMKGTISIIR